MAFPAQIVEVRSQSNPDKVYRVDVANGKCSCPAWIYHKAVDGVRLPCKHLKMLGITHRVFPVLNYETDL